ncbi:MAG: co-chaperone GroES family protein [Nanoarchaeota archaeon]
MIKPARGYVLIEATETDEVSAGGVLLPERMKDMPQRGKVLAVGAPLEIYLGSDINHQFKGQCEAKVGDTVVFKRFVDNRIKEDGKELLLVRFEDILGVYEK